jgi:hypothetical protein
MCIVGTVDPLYDLVLQIFDAGSKVFSLGLPCRFLFLTFEFELLTVTNCFFKTPLEPVCVCDVVRCAG